MKSNGQIAYEAYRNHSGGKSLISGATIPEWPDLPIAIQEAWVVAGDALLEARDEQYAALKADRDGLWDSLHEAAGFIGTLKPEVDRVNLYQMISAVLDGNKQS